MGAGCTLCSMLILVKPTKYHLDIVFTTSSSPLSFSNRTILCGYTTNHCTNDGWHFFLLFSACRFLFFSWFPFSIAFGIQGIEYSSQIYLLYPFNAHSISLCRKSMAFTSLRLVFASLLVLVAASDSAAITAAAAVVIMSIRLLAG